MKNLLILSGLLAVLSSACKSDDSIGPSDLLYKRWQILQSRNVNNPVWSMYDTDAYYDTEYQPDGTLIYRRNGLVTSTPCCSGSQFERNGVLIQYSEFIPCPLVLCASVTKTTITFLKDNLLELQAGDRITQYTPAQ
ncbi:hypothetical protein [Spirosoma flavum]|uniref:META domain-containing protein n=1 Tax=Spirosoma flavum TaxID=2048557 RepID=A0ABW6ANL6_9BACT